MNFYPVTDGRTESDAYMPTMQYAQVGSNAQVGSKMSYEISIKVMSPS